MKNKSKRVLGILFPMIISIAVIAAIFIFVAITWIGISDFKTSNFLFVLQLILKKAGTYSVLLSAIVATIFFQSYTASKVEDKDKELKIQNIGHYTLAFQREEDEYNEKFKGGKIVLEICTDEEYKIESSDEINAGKYSLFPIKFLTSKNISSNLKNIMVFNDDYFSKNKKEILTNYYSYCEKIKYPSPLYCSAKPTSELDNNQKADVNRYFNLFVKSDSKKITRTIWISAITDEGVLLFIKVKLRIHSLTKEEKAGYYCELLQQTSYFKHNNELHSLYR
ncbi:hypothetical protein [Clostridium tagluense]|uniref:hypothetical protein n=1 Tax=Clostridium tagluense TaxID=360422 RepID=UPI001C0BF18B|nr:hypothetical protein [Clostridium tagluense]MBU3130274.1 hypothetical protein [Clostridium tagluense]